MKANTMIKTKQKRAATKSLNSPKTQKKVLETDKVEVSMGKLLDNIEQLF
jgi:hypothetical protein